ncbi:MAG TPA: hypothetical protein VFH45_11690 [Acidimicrobiales bacterium]|nr:hypothetical protein [Acidimicrobiales bacterium]
MVAAIGALAATAGLSLAGPLASPAAADTAAGGTATATAPTPGYWLLTDNGGVMTFGGVRLYGAATDLGAPVVGMASTPSGRGYWIAAANGAVASLGDAANLGSAANLHLARPIVGITATPDGGGFWLVASDGGIFSFGDANFYGSTGAIRLNRPIVGMSTTPDAAGYRLVASDGGIFDFGDADFHGSTGAMRLNAPIVGMDTTPDGAGYWLVASDGGIFTFGDAPYFGSTGAIRLQKPIVAMSRVPGGLGYWLVASDGGVFSFGAAPFRGSAGGTPMLHSVRSIEEGPGYGTGVIASANQGLGPYASGSTGYDISWPQCGNGYPGGHQVAIVGLNDGHAFSVNPCLTSEVAWAGPEHGLYLNLNSPNGSTFGQGANGPAGSCSSGDSHCWAYNYGWNAAVWSMAQADAAAATTQNLWLDVETGNYWSSDSGANALVVKGAVDAIHSQGLTVGIYSTPYQWGVITGGATIGVPVWVATGMAMSNPGSWCTSAHAFNGGPVWMVQYGQDGFDGDYAC